MTAATILAAFAAVELLVAAVWAWQKLRVDAAELRVLLGSEIRA